jgi:hypothetical protein
VVLLFKDQLHQVVVAQGGKRGRQTHSADCMPAGQLPQGANQLRKMRRDMRFVTALPGFLL